MTLGELVSGCCFLFVFNDLQGVTEIQQWALIVNDVCVFDREYRKAGELAAAVNAVDEALKIYDEDDRVMQFREKLVSLMSASN